MDHVTLVDEDLLHPARLLGRHVHLDRFNPPIARGKPGRQRVQSGLVELPAEDPAPATTASATTQNVFPFIADAPRDSLN